MTTATLEAPPEQPLHRRLGLTDDELAAIERRLGRAPNDLELAMFSVMWSEHCSYKSSRPLLETLPTGGAGVLAGPGENAGVVDIGDGLAVAFKIESHNHPSAVEPYQGAATGVGGILRDVFTMGARPIASLDSLPLGLALGGDRGDLRRIALSFLEDLEFKDFESAALYHAPGVRDSVDIPFLIQRLFTVRPEALEVMDYDVVFAELDSIRLIDPHSHIEPKSPASKTLADILGYHYYTELAHSAGLPRELIEEPKLDPKQQAQLDEALRQLEELLRQQNPPQEGDENQQ